MQTEASLPKRKSYRMRRSKFDRSWAAGMKQDVRQGHTAIAARSRVRVAGDTNALPLRNVPLRSLMARKAAPPNWQCRRRRRNTRGRRNRSCAQSAGVTITAAPIVRSASHRKPIQGRWDRYARRAHRTKGASWNVGDIARQALT